MSIRAVGRDRSGRGMLVPRRLCLCVSRCLCLGSWKRETFGQEDWKAARGGKDRNKNPGRASNKSATPNPLPKSPLDPLLHHPQPRPLTTVGSSSRKRRDEISRPEGHRGDFIYVYKIHTYRSLYIKSTRYKVTRAWKGKGHTSYKQGRTWDIANIRRNQNDSKC